MTSKKTNIKKIYEINTKNISAVFSFLIALMSATYYFTKTISKNEWTLERIKLEREFDEKLKLEKEKCFEQNVIKMEKIVNKLENISNDFNNEKK